VAVGSSNSLNLVHYIISLLFLATKYFRVNGKIFEINIKDVLSEKKGFYNKSLQPDINKLLLFLAMK
jgi:hypothetical protein